MPLCIAACLIYRAVPVAGTGLLVSIAVCSAVVLAITFVSTKEIACTGIRVPVIIPALTALLAGLLLSGGIGLLAAVTAMAGGVFGTLSGGNLAYLPRVRDLEVSTVSIGGSGTFGSVFLCCILPALIA